ncbi:hypothetical protein ACH3XW_8230 [Acanthocheilonema viteae]
MERNEKKTFVFGSSTPRDLSYMCNIPVTLRAYDSKIESVKRSKDQTLSHYMRQARSVTRNQSGSREGSGDRGMRGTFAFGSSTPRILSHLYGITREYGNDRINPQVGRRSYTTPTFPTLRFKTTGASMNIQTKRNDELIKKPSDKNTCRVQSTSYQSKEGSEEFMNSVKKKLEAKNNQAKSMKKIAAKEKPSKNEKIDGSKTSVEKKFTKTDLPEAFEKLSSVRAGFGNEHEAWIAKEPKSETTFAEQRQLLTAASTVEDEVRPLSTEKIVANSVKTSEESGTIKILHAEKSEGPEIDVNIQSRSTDHDNLTDTFSIISKTDHMETEHKNETGRELPINSESEKRESLPPSTTLINLTIDSGTSSTKLSSVTDKTFSQSNDSNELKDCQKSSEDEIKDGETVPETSINPESENDKLSKIEKLIPENLHQLQGSNTVAFNTQSEHANAEHEIIYNHSYYSGTPISQECIKISDRENSFHECERRKSEDVSADVSVL